MPTSASAAPKNACQRSCQVEGQVKVRLQSLQLWPATPQLVIQFFGELGSLHCQCLKNKGGEGQRHRVRAQDPGALFSPNKALTPRPFPGLYLPYTTTPPKDPLICPQGSCASTSGPSQGCSWAASSHHRSWLSSVVFSIFCVGRVGQATLLLATSSHVHLPSPPAGTSSVCWAPPHPSPVLQCPATRPSADKWWINGALPQSCSRKRLRRIQAALHNRHAQQLSCTPKQICPSALHSRHRHPALQLCITPLQRRHAQKLCTTALQRRYAQQLCTTAPTKTPCATALNHSPTETSCTRALHNSPTQALYATALHNSPYKDALRNSSVPQPYRDAMHNSSAQQPLQRRPAQQLCTTALHRHSTQQLCTTALHKHLEQQLCLSPTQTPRTTALHHNTTQTPCEKALHFSPTQTPCTNSSASQAFSDTLSRGCDHQPYTDTMRSSSAPQPYTTAMLSSSPALRNSSAPQPYTNALSRRSVPQPYTAYRDALRNSSHHIPTQIPVAAALLLSPKQPTCATALHHNMTQTP
ncbi:hypothetical protein NDU88_010671 [Pleurodeles waltl]|uniref:Uncharacterized protein n=1 Tax=Pleurodeles waltl TaxID=8319 RepID=A0AAV7QV19_PLEWA|nr:hypothetical protein NDU88_010671 [Pleurodeles waltl]